MENHEVTSPAAGVFMSKEGTSAPGTAGLRHQLPYCKKVVFDAFTACARGLPAVLGDIMGASSFFLSG